MKERVYLIIIYQLKVSRLGIPLFYKSIYQTQRPVNQLRKTDHVHQSPVK